MKNYERARAEIDIAALRHNITEIQNNIDDKTTLIAVVKADAYGHGAVPAAKAAREAGVKMFGVAILDEAVELREAGITEPIIILGACFKQTIAEFINYDCEQNVFTLDMAREVQSVAKSLGKTAKIHIKLDTGMGRIGFLANEKSVDEIAQILSMENIEVKGIFTHFACSDHLDKTYTEMQYSRFQSVLDGLKAKGAALPPLHISNSGAIIDFRRFNYDFVRAGIILYGIYPSKEVDMGVIDLKPVMSVKSCVSFVKTLAPGECVSYNSRFKAARETLVATVPFGYADGFRRLLGNGKGRVLINGKFAPTIGDICMDQFMVDATDIGVVNIGDEVVLIGRQGENEITAQDMADVCGTIPYEVVCDFSKRVPRKYIGE